MIMPFLRLVIIYVVVILAALLVFKRDSVMSLLGMPWGGADTEISKPVKEAASPVSAPAAEPNSATTPASDAPQTAATETITPTPTQPPKYPTPETAQTPPPAPTQAKPASDDDIGTRLDQARKAYWNRDLASAETLYKALATDAPDNADIKGELGNLYYSQRRMSEAAQMYHQTGVQLIKAGNTQQIMPLIGVLQSIAPDMANDLRSRLSQ